MESLPELHICTACPVSLPRWLLHSHPMHNAPPSTGVLCCAVHACICACFPAASQLIPLMPALLRHHDASVRARSCNLLGNLCRHRWVAGAWIRTWGACTACVPARPSSLLLPRASLPLPPPPADIPAASSCPSSCCSHRFYGDLAQHGVVSALIELCRDPDRAARKFACFAIGNAGAPAGPLKAAPHPPIALGWLTAGCRCCYLAVIPPHVGSWAAELQ